MNDIRANLEIDFKFSNFASIADRSDSDVEMRKKQDMKERMKIIVAMDSFKGCLDSREAGDALARGIRSASTGRDKPDVEVVEMGDGGEGTAAVLSAAKGGKYIECPTVNPRFSSMKSGFFEWNEDGENVCAVDVAAAGGLSLLKPEEIDAKLTSSYGTGLLIRAALERRPKRIIVCLGGSATIDCGIGALGALGAKILDETGVLQPRELTGGNLGRIRKIDFSEMKKRVGETEIVIAADVNVGLLGDESGNNAGAVEIFGPQKGIFLDETESFRRGVENICAVLEHATGRDIRRIRGGGAAGGIGAALFATVGAKIINGAEFVIEMTGLREKMRGAAAVITGEGKSDRQTACGKLPDAVRRTASECGVGTALISGRIEDADCLKHRGFAEMIGINDGLDEHVNVMNPEVAAYRLMRAGYCFCKNQYRKQEKYTP